MQMFSHNLVPVQVLVLSQCKFAKVLAGVVGVEGAKVEDAKVIARLVLILVNYAALVPTVPIWVKAKSKHKLKYKVKFKFK